MNLQSAYQKAIKFATGKQVKNRQKVPGTNLPYVVHLRNVAMEIIIGKQFISSWQFANSPELPYIKFFTNSYVDELLISFHKIETLKVHETAIKPNEINRIRKKLHYRISLFMTFSSNFFNKNGTLI